MEKAERYKNDMVRFLSELTRIPSYSGSEKEAVELVRKKMNELGFRKVEIDGLGNISGWIGSGKRTIAIDGHLDVVDTGSAELWNRDPFGGDVDENWVYGRGTVDQKSGFVAALYGLKILQDMGCPEEFSFCLVGSVMEEDCDGLCWKYILEQTDLKPEMLVLTEPSDLRIMRGQRGRVEFKIHVQGSSAHASMPEKGDNAIYKMCKLVKALEQMDQELQGPPPLGKGSLVVSSISSLSPSVNAVPDHCEIYLDRRLTSGETREDVFSQIRRMMDSLGIEGKIEAQSYEGASYRGIAYPMEKYYPVWLQEEDSAEIIAARDAYRKALGAEPEVDCWKFSTNGTVAKGLFRIPSVGFGPGDPGLAHVPNEKVSITQLVKAAAFYAALPLSLKTNAEGQ